MSVYPNTGCHAVLALLSEGYPPLEGRSPTRYSPVCHSTDPLRDFRVRLACVRHAASVDSEPGSNSHVKFAGPAFPTARMRARQVLPERNCLTRALIEMALRCSIRWSMSWLPPDGISRSADAERTDCRHADRFCDCHALTLVILVSDPRPARDLPQPNRRPRTRRQGCVCACTHYLVFKEPTDQ